VLGISAGSARVRLGGEHGKLFALGAGDVVVIPAGVAHKNEGASPDLTVVGAYPGEKSPDMRKPAAQEREEALRNISEVRLPARDPVYGPSGPLVDRWRRGAARADGPARESTATGSAPNRRHRAHCWMARPAARPAGGFQSRIPHCTSRGR
jgi:hypothetical protein